METIDKEVLAGYEAGTERGRLRTDLGLIEFERDGFDDAAGQPLPDRDTGHR